MLIHVDVWQKQTQYCKAIILQLKINKFNSEKITAGKIRKKIVWRNISNFRYVDDTTLMAETEEELKRLLMKVKEKNEKAGPKTTLIKLRSWHLVLSLHCKYMGKKWKTVAGFIFLDSKIMVAAAKKFKNSCFLEEKL